MRNFLYSINDVREVRCNLLAVISCAITKNTAPDCRQSCSVQWLSQVRLFATPWTTTPQASLSITNSQRLLKLMSITMVMPSNHLILCRPLLLLPSIFPSIRVFSNESVLRIRWPKYWSFNFRDRKSTRLNSSHIATSRMPSSA